MSVQICMFIVSISVLLIISGCYININDTLNKKDGDIPESIGIILFVTSIIKLWRMM